MTARLLLAAAAAATVLLPASAPAQPRQYGYEEIASDLAYGFCPLFLAGQFPLNSPQLAERGFATAVQKQQDPRYGELQMVTLERADGEIVFGGAAGKVCSVILGGGKRGAALAKLRETMSWTGLDFKPAANHVAAPAGVKLETFRADSGGQALYVQLIEAEQPAPMVIAQLFVMDK
jgi:hypothetical protein